MKHYITYLANTDYCQLQPSDATCHRTEVFDTESKTEAVIELHRRFNFQQESSSVHGKKLGGAHNIWPIVWEIK